MVEILHHLRSILNFVNIEISAYQLVSPISSLNSRDSAFYHFGGATASLKNWHMTFHDCKHLLTLPFWGRYSKVVYVLRIRGVYLNLLDLHALLKSRKVLLFVVFIVGFRFMLCHGSGCYRQPFLCRALCTTSTPSKPSAAAEPRAGLSRRRPFALPHWEVTASGRQRGKVGKADLQCDWRNDVEVRPRATWKSSTEIVEKQLPQVGLDTATSGNAPKAWHGSIGSNEADSGAARVQSCGREVLEFFLGNRFWKNVVFNLGQAGHFCVVQFHDYNPDKWTCQYKVGPY